MRKLFSFFAAVVLSMTCVFAQDGWTWTESDIYPDPSTPFSEVRLASNFLYFYDVFVDEPSLWTTAAEIIIRNGSDVRTVDAGLRPSRGYDSRYYSDRSGTYFQYYSLMAYLTNLNRTTDIIDGATYTLHIPANTLKNKQGYWNGDMSFTYHQYTPAHVNMNYRFANDWVAEETLTQGVFAYDAEASAYTAQDDPAYSLNKPVSLLEVSFDDPAISHVEYVYVDQKFMHPIIGTFEKEGDKFVSHIAPALRFDSITYDDLLQGYGINAYEVAINAWTGTYVPGSAPTYRNVLYPVAKDKVITPYIHVPAELEGWRGRRLPGFISTDVINQHGEDSAYVYDAIQTYIEYYKNNLHLDDLEPTVAQAGSPNKLDCSDAVVVENGLLNMDLNDGRVYWNLAGQGRGFACPFIFFDTETFENGTHWHAYVAKHPKYGMDFELSEADFVACGVIGHGVKEQNHDGMHTHIHDGISHENPQEPTDYYTTFYDGLHTTIITSANTTAYAAKIGQDAEGTFVTLHAIDGNIIPQGVAVLLKGVGEEVVVEHYFDEAPSVVVPDNDLQGVDFTTAVSTLSSGTFYTLAAEEVEGVNTMAFYRYTGANMNPNKAYLQLSAGASAPRRITFGANTTTGVENVNDNNDVNKVMREGQLLIRKNGHLYNVQGVVVK